MQNPFSLLWDSIRSSVSSYSLDQDQQKDSEEISALAQEFLVILEAVKVDYESFHQTRLVTIKLLKECIAAIDIYHQNGQVAKASGATSGVVGGFVTLGGIVAAPFTGGGSLVALATGAVLAGIGAATQLGSDLAVKKFISDEIDKAKDVLEKDSEGLKKFLLSIEQYEHVQKQKVIELNDSKYLKAEQKVTMALDVAVQTEAVRKQLAGKAFRNAKKTQEIISIISKFGVSSAAGSGQAALEIKKIVSLSKLGINVGTSAAKIMVELTSVLVVISVAMDGKTLIDNIMGLMNKELNEMSVKLREILEQVEEQYISFHKYMDDLGLIDKEKLCSQSASCKNLLGNSSEEKTKSCDKMESMHEYVSERYFNLMCCPTKI